MGDCQTAPPATRGPHKVGAPQYDFRRFDRLIEALLLARGNEKGEDVLRVESLLVERLELFLREGWVHDRALFGRLSLVLDTSAGSAGRKRDERCQSWRDAHRTNEVLTIS